MIIIEENIPKEEFAFKEGKKIIQYGNVKGIQFERFGEDGKLTADFMKITIFDSDGVKISEHIKINKYQDLDRYDSLMSKAIKEIPEDIIV
jgi:hypothetical protein